MSRTTDAPVASPSHPEARALGPAVWDGRAGHLEVWYATATDAATGTGLWVHHEVVAATDGTVRRHGWIALFPPGEPARWRRFGDAAGRVTDAGPGRAWYADDEARIDEAADGCRLDGAADEARWRLAVRDAAPPLWTFSRPAWQHQLLPAAQVVSHPTAQVSGEVEVDGLRLDLDGPGALARIAGDGNAQRWAWLHADLGGGEALELVAAASRRPGLRLVPPRAFVALRTVDGDWPAQPALAALSSRVRLGLPRSFATVTTPTTRLRLGLRLPPISSVAVGYQDPDGARATCTNSCVADAEIRLERRDGAGWRPARAWSLRGTAHAEVGLRPPSA